MSELPFSLERTVLICARSQTVFRFFTDSTRFASWWGTGSEIEARPGGRVQIRYPNGVLARGEVLEVDPPRRIAFTYGYDDPPRPIPPGGSRVTVTLEERPQGTLVRLRHDVADAVARDHHEQGWRYQLAVFANVVANDEHQGATARVDALFRAWGEPDPAVRRRLLEESVTPEISFRDAFSATSGIEDLHEHMAAAQMHMPGVRLAREGDLRQCQGTAVARWVATGADGSVKGKGLNVYQLAPDGRIAEAVGLWER
jgi:uncharacterized protein YndB with AHSA1/START domain